MLKVIAEVILNDYLCFIHLKYAKHGTSAFIAFFQEGFSTLSKSLLQSNSGVTYDQNLYVTFAVKAIFPFLVPNVPVSCGNSQSCAPSIFGQKMTDKFLLTAVWFTKS